MDVNKETDRKVLLKKIEQTRRVLASTNDKRMIEGMSALLKQLETQLRQMG